MSTIISNQQQNQTTNENLDIDKFPFQNTQQIQILLAEELLKNQQNQDSDCLNLLADTKKSGIINNYENKVVQVQNNNQNIIISSCKEEIEKQNINDELQNKQENIQKDLLQTKQQQATKTQNQEKKIKSLRRSKSLTNVESLEYIYEEKSKLFQNMHIDISVELMNKFDAGLQQLELKDFEELVNEIDQKKLDIKQFEDKQQPTQKRKKSLKKLEDLKKIYDKINKFNKNQQQKSQFQAISEIQEKLNMNPEYFQENDNSKLADLKQDIENTPDSSEKLLLQLLSDSLESILENKNNYINQIELNQQLQSIENRLQLEELMNKDIRDYISSIQAQINSNNLKKVNQLTEKLLKQLRPLNISELKRLIEKTKNAEKDINNKDIVLFLGGSGVGKSTTIHFLAGSLMKQLKIHKGVYIAPDPTSIKNQNLQNVKVSPYGQSETKCIQPVEVNFKDICMKDEGSIILCDTPGFEDTRGPEVDIANGIGMINAIKGCKSIRPVIIISQKSFGDRGEGIKMLANNVSNLIKRIEEQLGSFSYLFTNFNDKSIQDIHALLNIIQKSIDENNDKQIVLLINDMIQKTNSQKSGQKIQVLNENPSIYMENIINMKPIENPDEVFEVFITQSSQYIVIQQFQLHKQSIISALKRNNYLLMKNKLDEMQFLFNTIKLSKLNQIYYDSVELIKDHLTKLNETPLRIKSSLKNNKILSIEEVKQCQLCIEQFQKIGMQVKDHLGDYQIQDYINNFALILEESNSELQSQNILEDLIKVKIDNCKMLAEAFPLLKIQYLEACKILEQMQSNIILKAEQDIKCQDYIELSKNLSVIKNQITNFQEHCNIHKLQCQYDQLINSIIDNLKEVYEYVDPKLQQPEFNQELKGKIVEIIAKIHKIKETYQLREHIGIEEVYLINDNLSDKIFIQFKSLSEEINYILLDEDQNCFKNIETLINQMVFIKELQRENIKIQELFKQTIHKIYTKMKEISREAEAYLFGFNNSPLALNNKKIFSYVKILKNAQWIDNYRKNSYQELIDNILSDLIHITKKQQQQLSDIDLDIPNYKNIEQAWQIILQFQSVRCFESISEFQELSEICQNAEDKFKKSIQEAFDYIQNNLEIKDIKKSIQDLGIKDQSNFLKNFDGTEVEDSLNYIEASKNINLFKESASKIFSLLKLYLNNFNHIIDDLLDKNFENIINVQNGNPEIINQANQLSNALQLILDLQKNEKVFKIINGQRKLCQWRNKLNDKKMNLNDQMWQQMINKEYIRNNLEITKALINVDFIFSSTNNFNQLYQQFQEKFTVQSQEKLQNILTLISKYDFCNVDIELNNFYSYPHYLNLNATNNLNNNFNNQNNNQLNIIKQTINDSLIKLTLQIKDKLVQLQFDKNNKILEATQSIVDDLRIIQTAKRYVPQLLDEITTSINNFEINLQEIQKTIYSKIKSFYEKIIVFINIHQFYEAEIKIELLESILQVLGDQNSEQKIKVQQLHDIKVKELKNVTDQFINIELDKEEYLKNPPKKILEQLQKCEYRGEIYIKSYQKIQESIIQKISQRLEQIDNPRQFCPTQKIELIEEIYYATNFLPNDIMNFVKDKLQTKRKKLEDQINYQKSFDQILQQSENNQKSFDQILQQSENNQKSFDQILQQSENNQNSNKINWFHSIYLRILDQFNKIFLKK